jgi:hypothetical protein
VVCHLPYLRQLPIPLLALLPLQFTWRSAPCPLCCVLVFSSLCVVQFLFFFFLWGSVCAGGYAGLSQGWLGEYHVMLGAHLFGLLNISQAGLELAAGGGGSPPVLSVKVAWRSLPWARGSGYRSFDSCWCFTSAKHGSSISERSLIHGSHAVCLCTSCHLGSPSGIY